MSSALYGYAIRYRCRIERLCHTNEVAIYSCSSFTIHTLKTCRKILHLHVSFTMWCALDVKTTFSRCGLVSGSETVCMSSMSTAVGSVDDVGANTSSMPTRGGLAAVRRALGLLITRFRIMAIMISRLKRHLTDVKPKSTW